VSYEYYTRLAATLTAAAVLGVIIARPQAGRMAVAEGAAERAEERLAAAERACAPGEAPLSGGFARMEDVLSLSPLSPFAAPGELAGPPDIRISTVRDNGAPRVTRALAPARADVVAIERRIDPGTDETRAWWTVRFKPCDKIAVVYDRLDQIDPALLRRAGGLRAFQWVEDGRLAIATRIRLREGEAVGSADGFDIALDDLSATPAAYAARGRYGSDVDGAAPRATSLARAGQTRMIEHARCPLDYLESDLRAEWAVKLGDARGKRLSQGENACRISLVVADAAEGVWFTDSSHNALASKVSAIALAPDAVDGGRLVFSLHGRLASLAPDMFAHETADEAARKAAARGFLTFGRGADRINAPFNAVSENETYCYEGLRANFAGPVLHGVLLLRIDRVAGSPPLMKIEAQRAQGCAELAEPWSFSGGETTFYRIDR